MVDGRSREGWLGAGSMARALVMSLPILHYFRSLFSRRDLFHSAMQSPVNQAAVYELP